MAATTLDGPESLARIDALLGASARMLSIIRECDFADLADVAEELRSEVARLRRLRSASTLKRVMMLLLREISRLRRCSM
jgi:hypothetical protein